MTDRCIEYVVSESSDAGMNILKSEHVSAQLEGRYVLSDVSLSIGCGELAVLRGPNGSGKSTLLKIIAGLTRPTCGEVWLKDRAIVGLPPDTVRRLGLAYLPQNARVFPALTVGQNLIVAWRAGGRGRVAARKELETTGLADRLQGLWDRRAGLLSRGQRQLVSIAMVVASCPLALILDEPLAPLSTELKGFMLDMIADVAQRRKAAVLVVEHNAQMVAEMAHRVYQLATGPHGSTLTDSNDENHTRKE
jgi:ABC-type branched-subunit amino acid transport system ATPase component